MQAMTTRQSRTVVVVGGGIAGLTCAYRLRQALGSSAEIVIVEQGERLGGKLRTVELAGRAYDVGAEAFLARRPEVPQLAAELGLGDQIVHPGPVSASIVAGGARCPIPRGAFMGIPASAADVREVVSDEGLKAIQAESQLPAVQLPRSDVSLGAFLRGRLGDEVVDRLVDPLLGGVYAGSADGLGLRATMPSLADALDGGARTVGEAVSHVLGESAQQDSIAADELRRPVFGTFVDGYASLVEQLTKQSHATVRLGTPVRSVARDGNGWRLETGAAAQPQVMEADGVVLAVPPPAARRLLSEVTPVAARHMAAIELASTVVIGMALPPRTVLPQVSGMLVAGGETHADGTPFTAKAFTLSSRKWPHLRGSGGEMLVRASVGRFGQASQLRMDDAELLSRVRADLAELTGVREAPVDSVVARWGGGLPQYGVGHAETVAEIKSAVGQVPGLAVAGAALHGVGVRACVASGEQAAATVAEELGA